MSDDKKVFSSNNNYNFTSLKKEMLQNKAHEMKNGGKFFEQNFL